MFQANMIVYQLALRTMTPEGTLQAATKMLPHIASLGVDIVYVCPFFVEENDEDLSTWSPRQLASQTCNPKNPYKIADYFNIDEEYGTKEDLRDFVRAAHENGLLVLFDLVYFHCAKTAVFLKEHPDFVEHEADGSLTIGKKWPFAKINFQNPELREYLKLHMKTMLLEYHADGFRCDVGDKVPFDFWVESFAYCKAEKPDFISLNEGRAAAAIDGVFDMSYAPEWNDYMIDVFAKGEPVEKLRERHSFEREKYGANMIKLIRTIDTHDVASDCGLDRNEITMGARGVEAALVVTNTFEGVPFLWNGYEICDNAENNMFSNRFYGKRGEINWSRGFTEDGKRRMAFIREIHQLHHQNSAIGMGTMEWIDNTQSDAIVSYVKSYKNERVLVLVNSKNKPICAEIAKQYNDLTPLMSYGIDRENAKFSFAPYGYIIAEIND